jgi:hypothetical protein
LYFSRLLHGQLLLAQPKLNIWLLAAAVAVVDITALVVVVLAVFAQLPASL